MSDGIEEARGKRMIVRFEGKKCIHSRNCVIGLPDVFRANVQGPWIHPDSAEPEALAALAHSCPSGAITYERLDGGPQESAPKVNTARIRENGPIALHGDVRIAGQAPATRVTLCRCGASKNKPYCDGSHTAAGFVATGEPATIDSPALDVRDGPLEVKPGKNGPVQITGNLEVLSGTGRTVQRTQKCWLCRCGSSANKPFCDGTHNRIGFESE